MIKQSLMVILFVFVAAKGWGQSSFFHTDSALIRGRIVDYSSAMGFHTLTSQIGDLLMGDVPNVSAEIREDGTFEKRLLLHHPVFNWFFTSREKMPKKEVPFYLCPGDTLDITVTFNGKDVPECSYAGGHAEDVARLLQVRTEYLDTYQQCCLFAGGVDAFNHWADSVYTERLHEVEECAAKQGFTPYERRLMLCDVSANFGQAYLSYFLGIRNTTNHDSSMTERLSDGEVYRVLRRLPCDDSLMMASMYAAWFLNRLNSTILYPLSVKNGSNVYVEDEDGDLEEELRQFRQEKEEELSFFRDFGREIFASPHDVLPVQLLQLQSINDATGFMIDMEDEAKRNFHVFFPYLSHPQVKEMAQRCFQDLLHQGVAYPLPEGAASEFVHKLLAEFPGRYLVLDLWAMWCGPCRKTIMDTKNARRQIRDRSDMKFIFLANENNPEDKDYQDFVRTNLDGEYHLALDDKQFLQLQDLFGFSTIPFNVTLTPDGRIVQNGLLLHAIHEVGYDAFVQQLEEMKKVCERE